MTEVAGSVVHEVLGRRALDVDQPIIDYIINVLADEDFDFGLDGEGAFEALGELLVGAGCVNDSSECRSVSLFIATMNLNLCIYIYIYISFFSEAKQEVWDYEFVVI